MDWLNTPTEFEYKLSVKSDIEVTYKLGYEDEEYKKLYRSKCKTGNYGPAFWNWPKIGQVAG